MTHDNHEPTHDDHEPSDDSHEPTDGTDEPSERGDERAGYELTRRDALAALAAGTGVAAAGAGALVWSELDEEEGLSASERETLTALARTVYPTEVSGVDEFVETYVVGRVEDRPDYAAGLREAIAALDEYARTWNGAAFADASVEKRDELLREMGIDVVEPDPDGSEEERVRYYLLNEVLYALYTSPTGGELVGLENPQGYPGGTESYRQPPADEREG